MVTNVDELRAATERGVMKMVEAALDRGMRVSNLFGLVICTEGKPGLVAIGTEEDLRSVAPTLCKETPLFDFASESSVAVMYLFLDEEIRYVIARYLLKSTKLPN